MLILLTDTDECIANTGICGADKVCINTEGSYLCQCKIGYRQLSNGNCQGMKQWVVIMSL